ncbi:MAG: hypothetical protein DRP97_02845 [Candidatus Latescibacterota bacterium]|nr:MAG: hypothetical protein DRP97_02845 [Candidatus Latescibacterota bacterium]
MKNLLLLKIGGGVITDKTKRYGLLEDVLVRLAREIADGYEQLKNTDLIIGNGAGSFAHYSAHEYRTMEGFVDERSVIGAGWVRYDAVKLNQLVFEELLRVGVPAFSFSPSSLMTVKNNKVEHVCKETLVVAIKKGFVPLVYGDPMVDSIKGCTIFSTEKVFDEIVRVMANEYKKIKVVHISSETGVYDLKNALKGGVKPIIPLITKKNFEQIKSVVNGSRGVDVTGGMIHKVEECLKLAKQGVESWIVSGIIKGRVRDLLMGKKVVGTMIK